MATKNKYSVRSKISEAKVRQIARLFALDLTALQIATIAGINRNTVNRYVSAFRERIARYCEAGSPVKGVVEVDESTLEPKGYEVSGAVEHAENHCFLTD